MSDEIVAVNYSSRPRFCLVYGCLWLRRVMIQPNLSHPLPCQSIGLIEKLKEMQVQHNSSSIAHITTANKSMKHTTGIFKWKINIQRQCSTSILIISMKVVSFFFFFFAWNTSLMRCKYVFLQVMHLFGKKRKVVVGQDFPPSVLLAGTNTHTKSCHIIQHMVPWD